MPDIYYLNSDGKRIDFDNKTYYLNRATTLFSHKWEYISSEYVNKIDAFNMRFVEKEFDIGILAKSDRDYDKALRKINDVFDYDVRMVQPGRLYCGEDYLNCYIVECNQSVYEDRANVIVKPFRLVAERGDWIHEEYFETIKGASTDYLDFTFDYPYDFALSEDANYVFNNSVAPADFIMRIYGALPNRFDQIVEINGIKYGISTNDVLLTPNVYIEINSIDKTLTFVLPNGWRRNFFKYRNKETDVFTPIAPGKWYINRNANFDVTIKLFSYKSEPDWWKG